MGELPTALMATYEAGTLHLAICAEYDAIAEIGHVCGHHLIAAMALGAAIGLASVAEELGMSVSVIYETGVLPPEQG